MKKIIMTSLALLFALSVSLANAEVNGFNGTEHVSTGFNNNVNTVHHYHHHYHHYHHHYNNGYNNSYNHHPDPNNNQWH